MISEVKAGRMSRRHFVQAMVGLGLTAPLASQMLASAGVAMAQPKPAGFTPVKRGGGGALKVLWWQAATLLNPHFATGTKDQDGSRIFYEPLVSFDPDGNLFPVLAAEVPSVQNGAVARDGRSGSSSAGSRGTTASPSPPTTWSSTGSTPPIPPPPP
jgi:peptide/nickel transport system substrate-binding protein